MHLLQNLKVVEDCRSCKINVEGSFCHLSPSTVEALDKIKLTNFYPKGVTLFFEGQTPRGVYMLCRGRVKISVCSVDGKVLILRIAEPGEILGLSATVSNFLYKATAETLEPCQINFIRREDFLHLLHEHGDACFKVAQQLSRNYHTANAQIRALGLANSALEKLARLILEWCEDTGTETAQGIHLKLGLTHEDIARMIGTSRETVTRAFGEFKHKQIIRIEGSSLLICNKAELEKLSGLGSYAALLN